MSRSRSVAVVASDSWSKQKARKSGAQKKRRPRYYSPKIIGYYPHQVVAMRTPPNPDPEKVKVARQKQLQLAKSISSPYSY